MNYYVGYIVKMVPSMYIICEFYATCVELRLNLIEQKEIMRESHLVKHQRMRLRNQFSQHVVDPFRKVCSEGVEC